MATVAWAEGVAVAVVMAVAVVVVVVVVVVVTECGRVRSKTPQKYSFLSRVVLRSVTFFLLLE